MRPDALILFSGGLDSLLAAKLLAAQGLLVRCLHFYSPFFGNPAKIEHWQDIYGLEIAALDATEPFVAMLSKGPPHGLGKTLNPCVDCKILLLELAMEQLAITGARFIATGEVLGQRPMSQRRDALNTIVRQSGSNELVLRPLSAQLLSPTPMEESGLVDRQKLLAISGRGRNAQLELAGAMGIVEIPSPAGGCRLTERENARRYWPLLRNHRATGGSIQELVQDFLIANTGRMLIGSDRHWLTVGRNDGDNKKIQALATPNDILLRLSVPGPIALLRKGRAWQRELVRQAAEILASYAPKAVQNGEAEVTDALISNELKLHVRPERHAQAWSLPTWEETCGELREERRMRIKERLA